MPLGIDFGQIFLHLFNVVILFGGLYLLLYKPVNNFMKKRADHYKEVDEAANAKLADAEAKVKEYEEKIAAADAEIAENKKTAAAELETFRENKKKEAEREAASILSSAEKKAEAERAGIVTGAKEDITKIIEEAAKKVAVGGDTEAAFDAFFDSAERGKQDGTEA
ncbi:MAG: ATP synthase F0 subunit B [Lachnospiraceae bacterium]|nr:ATP synthase F0 subunit B [Lachnospiraceae bacterium]